jgi:hypothetical protein
MSRVRKRKGQQHGAKQAYDTIPYRDGAGRRYTVYLCASCARAWKLPDPVEAWKVKALINHFGTHDAAILLSAARIVEAGA